MQDFPCCLQKLQCTPEGLLMGWSACQKFYGGGGHTQQLLDVLLRVGNRGTGHDELGAAPVLALTDAPQPPQHQRSVAAKHAPVCVAFVYHNVAQIGQEVPKLTVHGQHAAVQHVRVGDEQVRPVPNGSSVLLQGVGLSPLSKKEYAEC